MSFPVDENRGAPGVMARKRAALARQAERLRLHTVRVAPLPAHLSVVLVKQRVEVKTKHREITGVVHAIAPMGLGIIIGTAGTYDRRGFWSIVRGPAELVLVEQIERLTMLEGPIPVPLEDRGFLKPTEKKSKRETNYQLESHWIEKKDRR